MSGMEGGVDPVRELLRVQEVKWPLALEAGYTVSLLPVSVKDYERSQKPLLWNDVERRSPPLEGGRGPTQEGGTVLRRRRTVALRAGRTRTSPPPAPTMGASTWRKRCCSPRGSDSPGMDRWSRNTADAFSEGRRFLGDTHYHLALKEEAE